jgi:hyperosmotically inducible periplasmic protein
MNTLSRATVAALAIAAISIAQAQTAPDNTKQNATDSTNRMASADAQKNDKTDLMLTKTIRANVMADKSLSTYAHNVKIVTVNGNVTLNGVVHSQQEKDTIEAKAQAALAGGSLTNNLKVKP